MDKENHSAFLKRALKRLALTQLSIAMLALPLLLTACGSSGGSQGSSSGSISGNWEISLQPSNSDLNPKTESGFLSQSGNVLTGSMIFTDAPCSGVGSVSGTVSATAVSLAVSPTGITISHNGTLGSDQASMSGSYTILSTGCETTPQIGTWTANLVKPLNGSIQGIFTSNHLGTSLTVAGQLSQEANVDGTSTAPLSGNLNITGYCFATATIAGTVSGTSVVMSLLDSDGTQLGQVIGTSTLDGTVVTGTYNVIAQGTGSMPPCGGGDSGSVSLTL